MKLSIKNKTKVLIKKLYKSKHFFTIILVVIAIEIFATFSFDKSFYIYFLDIGQGDSTLIKTPEYEYILVDGGENGEVLSELGEVLPFWEKTIDVVVGTHADSDHIGGLVYVLEKYNVSLFLTSIPDSVEDNNMSRIREIAEEKNIPIQHVYQGDVINVGDVSFNVLWPEKDFNGENDNQMSTVLSGEFGHLSFLLTGDIEEGQEYEIDDKYKNIEHTILKVSHHGSKTASSETFVESVNPQFAVISCGAENKFGHPSDEVINVLTERGITIFRTDKHGRVEFKIDEEKYSYSLEKKI